MNINLPPINGMTLSHDLEQKQSSPFQSNKKKRFLSPLFSSINNQYVSQDTSRNDYINRDTQRHSNNWDQVLKSSQSASTKDTNVQIQNKIAKFRYKIQNSKPIGKDKFRLQNYNNLEIDNQNVMITDLSDENDEVLKNPDSKSPKVKKIKNNGIIFMPDYLKKFYDQNGERILVHKINKFKKDQQLGKQTQKRKLKNISQEPEREKIVEDVRAPNVEKYVSLSKIYQKTRISMKEGLDENLILQLSQEWDHKQSVKDKISTKLAQHIGDIHLADLKKKEDDPFKFQNILNECKIGSSPIQQIKKQNKQLMANLGFIDTIKVFPAKHLDQIDDCFICKEPLNQSPSHNIQQSVSHKDIWLCQIPCQPHQHTFHQTCLVNCWIIRKEQNTCPQCKSSILRQKYLI